MLNEGKLDAANSLIVAEWYEKYRLVIFKSAFKQLRSEDRANDVLQETFVRVINNFDKLITINEYQRNVYIKKTLNSVINDYYRREGKFLYVDDISLIIEEGNLCDTTINSILLKEDIDKLSKGMEKLSETDKILIQCKYISEMNRKEISKIAKIPVEYVSLYVGRAKKRLIKAVEEMHDR